jgi:hypothetical protein
MQVVILQFVTPPNRECPAMNPYRFSSLILTLAVSAALVSPGPDNRAAAAGLFSKKAKPNPAERVPELLTKVKSDPDERQRAAAAEELRQYETKDFPTIVPVLIDVLQHDAKPSVRLEAASSLGRLRPVSQEAGLALEQAASADPNLRVRLQARSSLVKYHLSGYHSPKKKEGEGPILKGKTEEPPRTQQGPILNPVPPPAPTAAPVPPPAKGPVPVTTRNLPQGPSSPPPAQTVEPPLPQPPPAKGPVPGTTGKLPHGPSSPPPMQTAEPPLLQPPPAAPVEGPILTPPP